MGWLFKRKKKNVDVIEQAKNVVSETQKHRCPTCGSKDTILTYEWAESLGAHRSLIVRHGKHLFTYRCSNCGCRFYA
jgi:transcription elongation factor Elf1